MTEQIDNEKLPEPVDQEGYYEYFDAKTGLSYQGVKKYEDFSSWCENAFEKSVLTKKVINE